MFRIMLALPLLASMTFSYAATWITNKDHSEILFQVPYMGVSEVTGRFNEFRGEVLFRENQVESLEVKILTSSIDTGNKLRDGHLKGSDFLEEHEYPYILFKSRNIQKLKANKFQASGEIKLKGIVRPLKIEFTMSDSLKDTWGFENRFVKFNSAINRKDFRVTWNKTLDGKSFLVGDEIAFRGTFQIQPVKEMTPASKHMIPDTEYIRERDKSRQNGKVPEEESSFSQKLRKLINGK